MDLLGYHRSDTMLIHKMKEIQKVRAVLDYFYDWQHCWPGHAVTEG
jgi:hypothetical protein